MRKLLIAVLLIVGCAGDDIHTDLGSCSSTYDCSGCLALTGCNWTGGECREKCSQDTWCYGPGNSGLSCPAPGGTCTASTDCSGGLSCYFKITDGCSAKGVCLAPPGGPQCGALLELCGCNGSQVVSGCGFPSGYASGASNGQSFCATDGGI